MRRVAVVVLVLAALAGACKKKNAPPKNLQEANKVAARTVRLYYESPDLLLGAEQRNLQLPENPAGAMALVVRELLKGSTNAAVPKPFPADTVVRGAFLLPDGTAFVDLGGPTLSDGWATGSHEEMIAVYAVVQTVSTNFPEAKRVRFLLNGEPPDTLGGHIAVDRPLAPMPSLVDPRAR